MPESKPTTLDAESYKFPFVSEARPRQQDGGKQVCACWEVGGWSNLTPTLSKILYQTFIPETYFVQGAGSWWKGGHCSNASSAGFYKWNLCWIVWAFIATLALCLGDWENGGTEIEVQVPRGSRWSICEQLVITWNSKNNLVTMEGAWSGVLNLWQLSPMFRPWRETWSWRSWRSFCLPSGDSGLHYSDLARLCCTRFTVIPAEKTRKRSEVLWQWWLPDG